MARLFSPLDVDAEESDSDLRAKDVEERDEDERQDASSLGVPPLVGGPRRVLAVAGPRVRAALAEGADLPAVRELVPGDQHCLDDSVGPGDLVVVDRAALAEGPWAGVETASGTRLAMGLLLLLDELRAKGCQVVMVDHARPSNVNTNLLIQRADILLPEVVPVDEVLGNRPRTPIMALLQEIASEQSSLDTPAKAGS